MIKPEFNSLEDYVIFNFTVAQLELLNQIERYLEKHDKQATIDFIKALKDSLK